MRRRQEHKPSLKHLRSSPNSATNYLTNDLTSLYQSCLNHNRRKSKNQRLLSFSQQPCLANYSCQFSLSYFSFCWQMTHWKHWDFGFFIFNDFGPLLSSDISLIISQWYRVSSIHYINMVKETSITGERKNGPECIWCDRHCARCVEACHLIFTAILWGIFNFPWLREKRIWGSGKVTKLLKVTNSLFYSSI